MEKFTVDLDKVLDELEYNEDRAENMGIGRRLHMSGEPSSSQTGYRRRFVGGYLPPQSAATTAHGVLPRDSHEDYGMRGSGEGGWRPKPLPVVSQKTSVSGVFSSLNEYINTGSRLTATGASGSIDGGDVSETSCAQFSAEPLRSPATNSVLVGDTSFPSEEKPDLIDSSVVRLNAPALPAPMDLPVQVNLPGTSTLEHGAIHCEDLLERTDDSSDWSSSQGTLLPDIATAGALVSTLPYEEANSSFDLISHRSSTTDADNLSSVVTNTEPSDPDIKFVSCTQTQIKENKTDFVGFVDVEDLSDAELNKYLQELEDEEEDLSLAGRDASADCNSQTVSDKGKNAIILEEMDSQDYCDAGTKSVSQKTISSPSVTEGLQIMAPDSTTRTSTVSATEAESSEESAKFTSSVEDVHSIAAPSLQSSEERVVSKSIQPALRLSIRDTPECSDEPLSPATPPTVPVTPTMQEAASSFASAVEAIATPPSTSFMTPTASLCEFPSSTENDCSESDSQPRECMAACTDEEPASQGDISSDQMKPVRPCSLQLTTLAEPASAGDLSGSSDESLAAFSVSVGPPGATPGANRPPGCRLPSTADLKMTVELITNSTESQMLTESVATSNTSECTADSINDVSTVQPPAVQLCTTIAGASSDTTLSDSIIDCTTIDLPGKTEVNTDATEDSALEDSIHSTTYLSDDTSVGATSDFSQLPNSSVEDRNEVHTDITVAETTVDESTMGGEEGAVGGEAVSSSTEYLYASGVSLTPQEMQLGKLLPFWVPDADAPCCMLCDLRFTVIKRRHHCRACGKVFCSKCCSERSMVEYLDSEARVCVHCKATLTKVAAVEHGADSVEDGLMSDITGEGRPPNPNNPMEYCSTVPPLQQVAGGAHQPAPSVMVPVGVLKREGSTKPKSEAKQVMFSDGIRPGGDLAELDGSNEPRLPLRRTGRISKRVGTPPGVPPVSQRALPPLDPVSMSYIPRGRGLPPIVVKGKDGPQFEEDPDPARVMMMLRDDSASPVKFTINRNLYLIVKILTLDCCVNRTCWCFTSEGLSSVGQDETVVILEVQPEESTVPKDIFVHLNSLYHEASKGNTVTEMGYTLTQGAPFLGSRENGGFLYVRPTFQCLHRLILPPAPYLVGLLIHRWETPWARIFPIRLMLRLGAEYRYYPCPLVSIREREAVYGEIGHTIIQLLADFRNMVYTLPTVRGLVIHMEDKQTTILLPRNRYDQVMRALNNSNDHVLAFGANFSQAADSHLVCMQSGDDSSYHTQAINIHVKPRKVTGASFVVFNGALKTSSGMAAKSTIIEDGLMVRVTSDTMASLKAALRDMKDLSIFCGPISPPKVSGGGGSCSGSSVTGGLGKPPNDEKSLQNEVVPDDASHKENAPKEDVDEVVLIKWTDDDRSFNIGVLSCVDGHPLDGVPSIRVHNGTDYQGEYRFIRWTEVFILKSEEGSGRTGDPVDISRLSEELAKATCLALVKLLDLLAAASLTTLAVRATIHPDNVEYQAGSNGEKLPPIYMNSLDEHLVPVLHEAAVLSGESPAVLELVFRIMESG